MTRPNRLPCTLAETSILRRSMRHGAALALLLPALTAHALEPPAAIARAYPINAAIAPCSDFYGHVCSTVVDTFELPDHLSAYLFSAMDANDRVLATYHAYLDELSQREARSPRERMLKHFHAACMDPLAAAADERRHVARVLGEMAAIDNRAAFQRHVADRIDSGETSFLMVETLPRQQDPTWDDVIISSTLRTLPDRSYYADETVLGDFTQVVETLFHSIGLDRAAERARGVVAFEKGFAQTYPSVVELRRIELDQRRIDRDALLRDYPALRLERVLSRIPAHLVLRDLIPDAYHFLDRALRDYDLERLKDIYLFNALAPYLDDGYPAFLQTWLAFERRHLGGPPMRPDRQQRCAVQTINHFGSELDAILQPLLFADFPRERIVAIVEQIRDAAQRSLADNAWLSEQGRAGALRKLEQMRLRLVSPGKTSEWDFEPLTDYDPQRIVANTIHYWDKHNERLFARLAEPRDWDRWDAAPLTVDAMYTASMNRFVLFQGILQRPFFDPGQPEYANLGGLGSLVGHELSHAIDDKGIHFDAAGRLRTWMSDADQAAFHARAQRLQDYLDRQGHHAALQLAEHLAEIVGLRFAYAAALPLIKDSPARQRRFFTRYAQNWCIDIRPNQLDLLTRTDPHPLGAARVNETIRHQAGFQEAFGCSTGDPMVLPEKQRISIW